MQAAPLDALAMRLRRAAGDVRSAGAGIPGYNSATESAAAELERYADDFTAVGIREQRVSWRPTSRRALLVAAILLGVCALFSLGAYRIGTLQNADSWAPADHGGPIANVPPPPGSSDANGNSAQARACRVVGESYPSLSAELRAHGSPPTVVVPPDQFPDRTLRGEAHDLAEILEFELGPAYLRRPWPTWVQPLDNYVGALRAVNFIERPEVADPPHVRAGIMDLYQHSLMKALDVCHIPA